MERRIESNLRGYWSPFQVEQDRIYGFTLGFLHLWIRHTNEDWYLAWWHDENPGTTLEPEIIGLESADEKEWIRWPAGREELRVRLVPVMPDRPVVVKPETPIRVPAGSGAVFFVNIPLWIKVEVGRGHPVRLLEVPTVVLSKTWFGDTESGEPCYTLKTRATRSLAMTSPWLNRAACPVYVENLSSTELDFQRLCLHVEYLSLFATGERLVTNAVNVTFRGEEQLSQINFERGAPGFSEGASLLQGPRQQPERNLLRRTFQVLRSLTGV